MDPSDRGFEHRRLRREVGQRRERFAQALPRRGGIRQMRIARGLAPALRREGSAAPPRSRAAVAGATPAMAV